MIIHYCRRYVQW